VADDKPWKKRREDDEDDDRPRGRARRDDDDEDDDRPRRRRRDDDEDDREGPRYRRYEDDGADDFDDYDDRPRGRGRGRLSRETLRGIAGNQKAIIMCILVYFCLIPVQFVIPPETRIVLAAVFVPLAITAAVFVFLLATKVYSTAAGVVMGILTLVPCIGLLALLIINGKATTVLKENGIRVGFLGANSSDI
jgi:hypothetical protein